MKLSQVLATVSREKTASTDQSTTVSNAAPSTDKTAAAAPTATSPTGDKLKLALQQAMAPAAAAPATGEKQAAATSPVEGLTKMASDVLSAEHDALKKEAEFFGAAVADAAVARLGQWNEMLGKIAGQVITPPAALAPQTKVAAEGDSFEKFAAENPELTKQAAEVGYAATMQQMEKIGEAAYGKGYNDGVEAIYKVAHSTFVSGYRDVLQVLEAVSK